MFNQQVFTRENREDIGKGKVKGYDTGKWKRTEKVKGSVLKKNKKRQTNPTKMHPIPEIWIK